MTRKRRLTRSRQDRKRVRVRTEKAGLINRYVNRLFGIKEAFENEARRQESELLVIVAAGVAAGVGIR